MTQPAFHLAQVNIGRLRGPLDSPLLADFVSALAPINALADAAPGFVWRLQGDAGNATEFRFFDDQSIIVNMSTWESLEALSDYVYRSAHTEVMRRRKEWFESMPLYLALWWVPSGHRPSIPEAEARVRSLEHHGPTPFAFTFRQPFPPTTR